MTDHIDPAVEFLKKEWLSFVVNEYEKIVVQFDIEDVVHCCSQVRIFYVYYNHKILLSNWEFQENIEHFITILHAALQDQLIVHSQEHEQELGYVWNFICKKKNIHDEYSDTTFEEREKLKPYLIFDNHDFATWMYNDKQGAIFLKITPMFPKGKPRKRITKYHTFLWWMKTKYKPKLIRILSRQTVADWLEQAQLIAKTIQTNVKIIQSDNE